MLSKNIAPAISDGKQLKIETSDKLEKDLDAKIKEIGREIKIEKDVRAVAKKDNEIRFLQVKLTKDLKERLSKEINEAKERGNTTLSIVQGDIFAVVNLKEEVSPQKQVFAFSSSTGKIHRWRVSNRIPFYVYEKEGWLTEGKATNNSGKRIIYLKDLEDMCDYTGLLGYNPAKQNSGDYIDLSVGPTRIYLRTPAIVSQSHIDRSRHSHLWFDHEMIHNLNREIDVYIAKKKKELNFEKNDKSYKKLRIPDCISSDVKGWIKLIDCKEQELCPEDSATFAGALSMVKEGLTEENQRYFEFFQPPSKKYPKGSLYQNRSLCTYCERCPFCKK